MGKLDEPITMRMLVDEWSASIRSRVTQKEMAALPPALRVVHRLRVENRLTYEEIATFRETSIETVRVQCREIQRRIHPKRPNQK